eukprot:TRINITY_DN13157_c0_g1_i2.p1 TRINITY_DN13157_c0_g1~~TRINITY_DN13157_c0_g1_i2.p1  ORF type:complete len:439 (+),score=156.98 TRINITY_DN13157_c0_g1_i2:94-1410(+)
MKSMLFGDKGEPEWKIEDLKDLQEERTATSLDLQEELQSMRQQLVGLQGWQEWQVREHNDLGKTVEDHFRALRTELEEKADNSTLAERLGMAKTVMQDMKSQLALIQQETAAASQDGCMREARLIAAVQELRQTLPAKADASVVERLRSELQEDMAERIREAREEDAAAWRRGGELAIASVERSYRSVAELQQQLTMEVGKKADVETLELRLQAVKDLLFQKVEQKADEKVVAATIKALGCNLQERIDLILADLADQIQGLRRLQASLAQDLNGKLDERMLGDMRLQSAQSIEGKADKGMVSAGLQQLRELVALKADENAMLDAIGAARGSMMEMVASKAEQGDVNDRIGLLQFGQQELAAKLEKMTQMLRLRVDDIQVHVDERLAIAVASTKPISKPTPLNPVAIGSYQGASGRSARPMTPVGIGSGGTSARRRRAP